MHRRTHIVMHNLWLKTTFVVYCIFADAPKCMLLYAKQYILISALWKTHTHTQIPLNSFSNFLLIILYEEKQQQQNRKKGKIKHLIEMLLCDIVVNNSSKQNF